MKIVNLHDRRGREAWNLDRKQTNCPYELYLLPFFNAKANCMWDVHPTGDYSADCEMGHAYAIVFLKTADGTERWTSLLGGIVADIIRAAPATTKPLCADGVVVGFMSTLAGLLNAVASRVTPDDLERLPSGGPLGDGADP